MNSQNATSKESDCMSAMALTAVLSCVSTPVFLLGLDGFIFQQNVAANDLLTGRELRKLHSRLVSRRSDETDQLASAIARVAAGNGPEVFCLFRRDGTVSLMLTIATVTGADLLTICIADLQTSGGDLADFLQRALALTSQGAELAKSLMYGLSMTDYAQHAGVTLKVANARLQRLLARTGNASRATLVSGLWRAAAIATLSWVLPHPRPNVTE